MLTGEEVRRFVAEGYVTLRGGFTPELAERVLPFVWSELGLDPDDPSGWREPSIVLQTIVEGPAADEIVSERYRSAVDLLVGAGRWRTLRGIGHWPVSFPGFAQAPWRPLKRAWHVDGSVTRHRLERPARGLVGLELFTDVEPGSGGTAIRVGSHRRVAGVLAAAGTDGLSEVELNVRVERSTWDLPVVEAHGRVGDVVLLHPMTVHAASTNTGATARIMANRPFWLLEPLNLDRPESPVEVAVADGLAELAPHPARRLLRRIVRG